jgi:acyl-CoA thioester hydrolase
MRRKKIYFQRVENDPPPLVYSMQRRARFGEVDAMAVMWHGHYAVLFEEASTELRRRCGLGYGDFFEARIMAPIAQLHVDYHQPLQLDELATVKASMIWSEAARLNIEFEVVKENGTVAATGYTVQLFAETDTGLPCFTIPAMLEKTRQKWSNGEILING